MTVQRIAAFLAALSSSTAALAQPYGDGHMGWGWGDGWGHMFGGGLLMLLFWVAVIAVIVWLVVAMVRRGSASGGRSALDILEERYARGEIDRADYEARRQDLMRDKR